MISICSWCQYERRTTVLSDDGKADGRISHGICKPHYERELAKMKGTLKTIIPERLTIGEANI